MMMEGELDRALSHGRTTRAIERLERHVVLCGFGRIGQPFTGPPPGELLTHAALAASVSAKDRPPEQVMRSAAAAWA